MNIMRNLTKSILFILLTCTAIPVSAQTVSFESTIGMLNSAFKTFRISRKQTNREGIELFQYEFPLQGLESDSKQIISGVVFYIDKNGNIVLIRPIATKQILPDQKTINTAVNSAEKASEIFSRSGLEDIGEIQTYGLLSKWAVAVLSRSNGVVPNLDLTEKQESKINELFGGRLRVPKLNLSTTNENYNVRKIEDFAKNILQFDLQN